MKDGCDRRTPKYVVDASVVLKWVLPEETGRESAFRLRDDLLAGSVELSAPSLLTQETANALWVAVKRGRIGETDARDALTILQDTQLKLRELGWTEVSASLAISCEMDISVYDAAYILLCGKLGCKMITADDDLLEKTKHHFSVMHIKDY